MIGIESRNYLFYTFAEAKLLDESINEIEIIEILLKTVDIRSPKTVISVHFSYSLPMAMQIY